MTDAHRRLEFEVFGSDFGADGWTTLDQAAQLLSCLDLRAGSRMLDIGTGRGWPGLYLAAQSGCDALLTDRPVEGLRQAIARAQVDGVAGRVSAVAASAPALPFRSSVFDVIVHTDVLCCLGPKIRMLKECHRVLKPGGRMAFFVIHLAPGLAPASRRRAIDVGPPAVDTRGRDYVSLLQSTLFRDVDVVDVTATYRACLRAWLQHARAMADDLATAEPPGAFAQRVAERTATSTAVDQGLLRRSLLVARA